MSEKATFDPEQVARRHVEDNKITRIVIRFGPDFLLRAARHAFMKRYTNGPDAKSLLHFQQRANKMGLPNDRQIIITWYQLVCGYTADKLSAELGRRRAFRRVERDTWRQR